MSEESVSNSNMNETSWVSELAEKDARRIEQVFSSFGVEAKPSEYSQAADCLLDLIWEITV